MDSTFYMGVILVKYHLLLHVAATMCGSLLVAGEKSVEGKTPREKLYERIQVLNGVRTYLKNMDEESREEIEELIAKDPNVISSLIIATVCGQEKK